ncbi:MAG TPA: hypothetical protein VFH67_01420 [bacterium]|nr:hypothetical protein [bacterium]
MTGKLVTLVALFSLLLSTAAFASPADPDLAGETAAGIGEVEMEARVGEHDQEEEEFELYLGRQEEITAGVEDRRVD